MSDEFDIIDDEDGDSTLALDDDELADAEDEFDDGDMDDLDDAGGDDEEFEEDEPIRPPKYRADSNVYTIFLALSFVCYSAAIYVILLEMRVYCEPAKFLWGMFAKE